MRRRDLSLALPFLALPTAARAQAFPTRQITMIVPFPPGGQADLAARPVAAGMEQALGQAVVIQNRGGAGGAIGNAAVARAPADGYTVLMALSSLAVLPEADRLFGRPPQYEMYQLVPIGRVLADPTMLAVRADSPWTTLEEFVAAAKAAPGSIPYGSSGTYGTLHVAMEMFAHAASIRLLHVPFQGAGPALTALIGGQVRALASAPGTLTQHVREGRMRVLACWGAERVPAFPEVPTFLERGFAGVEFYIWAGLFAPAGTPQPVQEKLREGLAAAMRSPIAVRAFETAGSPPAWLDQPDFARFVAADSARLLTAVRAIGKVE
ncbi:Bug family tripartite tricarboxylate transporter substrate binding protein [Elioraea rosea]|uniref:Bug family tripartite tricarboxylate transporter substrate binding protein n=1 Tax=Elioraea rosea TaxID=2492390 RepID=UPI0011826D68|nr:tripartite tricarboxylate transporter substrate binding protein [Elioraea rosea]